MNTQTAGVWVKEYDNDTGLHDESFREWWIVTNGEYSFDCRSEKAADFLLSKLNIPTLTIQQALEVWDACDKHIEEVQQYPYGTRSGKYKNPDKHTYFLNKFGFDIDKM